MIRGTDGLDYEDLTARLLDQPAKTPRNVAVAEARRRGKSPRWVHEYMQVWDVYKDHRLAAHAADTLVPETTYRWPSRKEAP